MSGVASSRTDNVIRVLTWNLQRAGTDRSRRQASWLLEEMADVLVLTEVGPGGGRVLPEELDRGGYVLHGVQNSASGAGVVLAARGSRLESVPVVLDRMAHRCEAALLRLPCLTLALLGVYVPSRGGRRGRNVAKREFQTSLAALLPSLPAQFGLWDQPILIAGDLNVVEPGHRPHHRLYGEWEYDFYRSFGRNGYADVYRHQYPDVIEHSWIGRRSGAGYRFDHIFCSSAHLGVVAGVRYLHTPRRVGLSDHSAMALDLHSGCGAASISWVPSTRSRASASAADVPGAAE